MNCEYLSNHSNLQEILLFAYQHFLHTEMHDDESAYVVLISQYMQRLYPALSGQLKFSYCVSVDSDRC